MLIVVLAFCICAVWVFTAPVPKGAVLVVFVPDHGIDESDLAIIPFLAVIAWFLWSRRSRPEVER